MQEKSTKKLSDLIKGGQGRSDKAIADSAIITTYCLILAVVAMIMAVITA